MAYFSPKTARKISTGRRRKECKLLALVAFIFLILFVNIFPWLLRVRNSPSGIPKNGSLNSAAPGGDEAPPATILNGDANPAIVAAPSTEVPTEDTAEDLLSLYDSLTAQQLIDGGYSYLSYAEIEDGGDKEGAKQKTKKFSKSISTHNTAIAKPYDAMRSGRVCDPLPSNISLTDLRKETKRIGTYKEYWYTGDIDISPEEALQDEAKAAKVLSMRTKRPTAAELQSGRGGNGKDDDGLDEGAEYVDNNDEQNLDDKKSVDKKGEPQPVVVKYAYVLMISNHKYVDGALVVAQSLRQHSAMVKSGEADLVLIISEKIKLSSVRLLTRVFTRVKIMYTMAAFAPQSYYSTTFDKIYLFWLTEYKVILFMDADSLVTGNPDGLLIDKEIEGTADDVNRHHSHHRKPKKATPLTAVGGGDYFQTGLLIAKPNRQLFTDLYLEFRLGLFQYNQWRARDGVLMRTCFMQHHTNIEHPVDRLYHFYGFVKPWFNKDGKYKYGKGDEKLQFNPNYWDWWRRYEELHERYFVTIEAVEQLSENRKSSNSDRFSDYVYGNSANFPDKDVPIPGTSLTHPYTKESVEAKKVKGGWTKFDATEINKKDFPTFYDLVAIERQQRQLFDDNDSQIDRQHDKDDWSGVDGPRLVTDIVKARNYMWIQRFSVGAEYFRPTFRHYASIYNISVGAASKRLLKAQKLATDRHQITIIGSPGDSCTETCDKESLRRGLTSTQPLLCVEEALKATEVNDCFYGAAKVFEQNSSVVMSHGTQCDLCIYEYKSDAAPFVLPTTARAIAESKGLGGKKGKRKKSKKDKRKPHAKEAEVDEARAHYQEAFEEDDSDRRKDIAADIEGGSQRRLNECRVNFMHEKTLQPTCEAKREAAERVCVCV